MDSTNNIDEEDEYKIEDIRDKSNSTLNFARLSSLKPSVKNKLGIIGKFT